MLHTSLLCTLYTFSTFNFTYCHAVNLPLTVFSLNCIIIGALLLFKLNYSAKHFSVMYCYVSLTVFNCITLWFTAFTYLQIAVSNFTESHIMHLKMYITESHLRVVHFNYLQLYITGLQHNLLCYNLLIIDFYTSATHFSELHFTYLWLYITAVHFNQTK